MTTRLDEIVQIISEQDLINKCTVDTDSQLEFEKLTSPTKLTERYEKILALESGNKVPINYITFDDATNEFHFNTDLFNKENGEVTNVQTLSKVARWVWVIANKYVVLAPLNTGVASILKTKIPVIYKT